MATPTGCGPLLPTVLRLLFSRIQVHWNFLFSLFEKFIFSLFKKFTLSLFGKFTFFEKFISTL
jgi:hypothetical protein